MSLAITSYHDGVKIKKKLLNLNHTWQSQMVVLFLTTITLSQSQTQMTTSGQQKYEHYLNEFKLPGSAPKKLSFADHDIFLQKCTSKCHLLPQCFMFCFNFGVCVLAQCGDNYTVHTGDTDMNGDLVESMKYTCFLNEKFDIATPDELVQALGLTNVAVGKPITMNEYKDPFKPPMNSAVNLVDGYLGRSFTSNKFECANGDQEDTPWLLIDLQSTYLVFCVNITNNDNEVQRKRFHDTEVRIGMIERVSESNSLCTDYRGIGDDYWFDFCQPKPIVGRYVTAQIMRKCLPKKLCPLDSKNLINFCEVQVFVSEM